MSDPTTTPVTGIDGRVPIYDKDGRWTTWSIHELWMGQQGYRKYVPNVKDHVVEPETYTTYIVDHVDPVTLIPTLREIKPAGVSFTFSEDEVLLGVGPTAPSESYRAYLDRSTTPYTMNIDRRCYVPGSAAKFARVFRGSYISGDDNVISKVFDANGQFVSDRVGLELAMLDSHQINQHTLKIVNTFHTTEGMLDGEVVTLVVYTEDGHVCYKRQLKVENTSFIPGVSTGQRYVAGISLESSYLVSAQDAQLEFPLNLPLSSLDLMAIVHYSDGSTMELPVSDPRVRVEGLDQYVSNIPGHRMDLVLFYQLAPGESTLNTADYVLGKVRKRFTLTTSATNYAHAVQLMGYPIWQSDVLGYRMQFWMFNLDRTFFQDVTQYVEWSERTGPFDPKGYGLLQQREVSIDLSKVSRSFKSRRHIQVMDIVLLAPPNQGAVGYTMAHVSDTSYPPYQGSLRIKPEATGELFRIDNGITDLQQWLSQVYYSTRPLADPTSETSAPRPTHVIVRQDGDTTTIPITLFNSLLTLGRRLTPYSTATLTFIKRTSSGDMYLGISAMLVNP